MKPSSIHPPAERALAAIVLTDAVSFSARMSVDEEGTLALIQRDLDLIAEQCECFGGNVLKSTGDGLLMSFYSAVQAVLCSQEVQKQLTKLSEGLPPEEYLQHRIGIHLGDVLFSQDDVLGNGVNIAARLQTKSAPGGICISQTVYDVVKARLDINASFLGPLKLKNIQEPVTAYQIPPYGQSATMVVAHPSAAASTSATSTLEAAVATLQQDPQYRRIQKLVFGTYQGVWENDAKVLAQFDLQMMLSQLRQRYHTLIALEKALQTMASRLNHKDIYLAIADTILTVLEPMYDQPDEPSDGTVIATSGSLAHCQEMYQQAAQRLMQHSDRQRIKKLLYAILYSTWENDPAVLALHTLAELVAEVHNVAPTESDLSYHLERIIKRLNRKARYTQLALVISEAMHPIYAATASEMVSATALADHPSTSDEEATVLRTDTALIPGDDGITSLTNWVSLDASGEQTCAQRHPAASPNSAIAPEQTAPAKSRDRANFYSLRLEIMRYTNPLRAKILLLSTVRSPFTASRQDWILLKSKSLDDLLHETFAYCQTFSDLESKLTIMCHCVENVGENIQTAGAILQAMKPFYP
ncbi:adenylate/guanylate cyclase domain-containing protein [Leptolyngbya iicbica]|uniref:Adenylate/guanylate cyclase domain-containing protein n=2 Tax=Cyanophyceae TaxID=3028117 RepID=A0A4Q7E9P7_9CYAN|nr:adenylate/guanylate cyclase domain-containing protein [Leptolyngbya sp. LK]RZM79298.1 adenylate/guanylate cyclase domain-containing protein [Leptolyngbya sp. LK]